MRCGIVGDLGDGVCVEHWDKGLDLRDRGDSPVKPPAGPSGTAAAALAQG